jgi:Arc/MetJ family transcription regulator
LTSLSKGAALKRDALISLSGDDAFVAVTQGGMKMRTTVVLDDELLAKAEEYTGIREKSALIRAALRALVEREAARRLARIGGSEPDVSDIPRRRLKRR